MEDGSGARLRVHVCIDQPLGDAGTSGLVRVWRCLAEQARHDPEVALTVHGVGRAARVTRLAEHVTLCEHPVGALSTAGLERLGLEVPTHVGFWPHHRGLARALRHADVIHTTYTHFSFAMTALRVARARGIPLVSSLQTQVPQHAEIYARELAVRRGARRWSDGLGRRVEAALAAQSRWYFARCDRVLVSSAADLASLPLGYPVERVVRLGRGVDVQAFHPALGDRKLVRARFGVPPRTPVLLYVGKLMPEKNLRLLGLALRSLAERGRDFRLLLCGRGALEPELRRLLGPRARFVGVQPHAALARVYAAADLLTFPSATETFGQVVMEAMCSGLAPVVSARGASREHLEPGADAGLMVHRDAPEEWADALRTLLGDPGRVRRMGRAARGVAEGRYRSWAALWEEVVKPAWKAAFKERSAARPG